MLIKAINNELYGAVGKHSLWYILMGLWVFVSKYAGNIIILLYVLQCGKIVMDKIVTTREKPTVL